MRKKKPLIIAFMLAAACLCLSACERYPERAVDGSSWDRDWTMLGSSLGVESPGHALTLLDNNVVLAGEDTYYAAWVSGEPSPYVNDLVKDVDLYPAQIYLLYYGCRDEEAAREATGDWMQRQEETFTITGHRTETHNGIEYSVLDYLCDSEGNPYERGVSAFAVFEDFAVSVEFDCVSSYRGDAQTILSDFLDGCHYSSPAR